MTPDDFVASMIQAIDALLEATVEAPDTEPGR
jgi:hypothetical protein